MHVQTVKKSFHGFHIVKRYMLGRLERVTSRFTLVHRTGFHFCRVRSIVHVIVNMFAGVLKGKNLFGRFSRDLPNIHLLAILRPTPRDGHKHRQPSDSFV